MIEDTVNELITYARFHLYMKEDDALYFKNILLGELNLKKPNESTVDLKKIENMQVPDELVSKIKDYLMHECNKSEHDAELFTTKLMGIVSPNPSLVIDRFNKLKLESPRKALDYLYNLSIKNDYIAKTKIDRNLLWDTDWEDKNLEISVNLSKPEKNNKDIAKLLSKKDDEDEKYPKCLLCHENIGFFGNDKQPARENIRLIPLKLGGETWYLQYSPYGYFYMHCIVLKEGHTNMKIDRHTFECLADFVDQFPCFFIGSNADLPIVGGSILNHEHYQGGEHLLPVMKQKPVKEYKLTRYHKCNLYKLDWYNSTLLIESEDKTELINLANEILTTWRNYNDPLNNIVGFDIEGRHNTVTPSIRKEGNKYMLYLILRNNKCNKEYPDGIFHAHPEYHMIKKEGIGIIEAMGLFILPARLVRQSNEIKDCLSKQYNKESIIEKYPDLEPFLPMINELDKNYNPATIDKDIREYINNVCKGILINTAVFKDNVVGKLGLDKFIGGMHL